MTTLNTRLVLVAVGVLVVVIILALAAPGEPTSSTSPLQPTVPAKVHFPVIARADASPTATASPTSTPSPTRTPVNTPLPGDWLLYVNYFRTLALLPAATENSTWSSGCWYHARYTVKNDVIQHSEDPGNPWYTAEGDAAASSSNLMGSSDVNAPDEFAIDLWMQGPFHAVGVIDPALGQVGFGSYRESIGVFRMGAALDVIRGLGSVPPSVQFPVIWPADGMTVPLRMHGGGEYPDPLAGCPGYGVPSGLPVILQIGAGNLTPNVTGSSFKQGSTPLEHCVFDETSYTSSDPSEQSLARSVLNARDAIVLIPRAPLNPGASYTASITVNGSTYTWTFTVSSSAQTGDSAVLRLIR